MPRNSNICQKVSALFRIISDFVGVTYVLRILKISRFPFVKIPPPKIFENARRNHVYWIQKSEWPTNTKIPRKSTIGQQIPLLFHNHFWLSRIYSCFQILKIFRFPKQYLRNTKNKFHMFGVWLVSEILGILDFQNDAIWKNNIV